MRHAYYASVSWLDFQVGRVLDSLGSLALVDETVVVFHSDHGFQLGEHNSWHKFTNFELGTRVPLIIRAPHIAGSAGRRTAEPVELVDVFPTLAAMVQTKPKDALDGTSLVKYFTSPPPPKGGVGAGRHGRIDAAWTEREGSLTGGHNAPLIYAYSQFPHSTNYNCTFFRDGACHSTPTSPTTAASIASTAPTATKAAFAVPDAVAGDAMNDGGALVARVLPGSDRAALPAQPVINAEHHQTNNSRGGGGTPEPYVWPNTTMMGYSVRDQRWRFVVWLRWNGTAADWTADVGTAGRFDELYDHGGDTGKDFDAMDVVNLAYNASYGEIVAARFTRAKAFFQ